jgi:hypothetical protein
VARLRTLIAATMELGVAHLAQIPLNQTASRICQLDIALNYRVLIERAWAVLRLSDLRRNLWANQISGSVKLATDGSI